MYIIIRLDVNKSLKSDIFKSFLKVIFFFFVCRLNCWLESNGFCFLINFVILYVFFIFERVKKDGMCFFCVGIIDKDESFFVCFS